jgi:hypothetical protein
VAVVLMNVPSSSSGYSSSATVGSSGASLATDEPFSSSSPFI